MRNALITLGLLLALPVLMLCLPVILHYVLISQWQQRRRLARTPCPACGVPFGRAEIDRARAACEDSTRETVRHIIARGGRPRIVAIWRLCCPACGAHFTFAPSTDQLRPAETAPAA